MESCIFASKITTKQAFNAYFGNENERMSIDGWIRNREQRGHVTFAVSELQEVFADRSSKGIKTELRRLTLRGRIVSVFRGFYVIIPVQYQLKRIVPPSYYVDELMRYVGKPYYVSLLSAAALHGATHQRSMQYQIMTVAPRLKKGTAKHPLLNWCYRPVIPESLLVIKNAEMGILRVSNPELTAVDLIQFADYVGGYQRAATVLAELVEAIDIRRMEAVIPYTKASTIQRFGYILEFVLGESEMADQLYATLKKHFPKRHSYCMSTTQAPSEESLPNRWYINMNIEIEIDDL